MNQKEIKLFQQLNLPIFEKKKRANIEAILINYLSFFEDEKISNLGYSRDISFLLTGDFKNVDLNSIYFLEKNKEYIIISLKREGYIF